jgi:hypothetical protein
VNDEFSKLEASIWWESGCAPFRALGFVILSAFVI